MADKTALVLLAEGAEEMELVISIDVMRRAGIRVMVAGVAGASPVRCRRDTLVVPDVSLVEAMTHGTYDAVVLPGGIPGAKNLAASSEVGSLLREQERAGRFVCAICAAPTVLKAHGVGYGKNITSFPPLKDAMVEGDKYNYKEDKVVVDGKLITSRGPGTAFDFALRIVEEMVDKEAALTVAKAMLLA
ncbi:Parkinson disease protein 7 homolog [Schistocerca americana]|uniref:Parkinson disease protein 7 homolog n=1 Tax=Schistocerca americana TaxID=7009 RepID=UPI001F502750|nr:Parkinson disease protein 7 homolog [Schistocerca americana]